MVNLKINGHSVSVAEGTTIMDAAAQNNITIPHLCYLKELNEIGACRVCCVEVKGEKSMVPACTNPVKEGMEVFTNSPKARKTRRTNVQLLLSQHDSKCAICPRSGSCQLQKLANDLGIMDNPYPEDLPKGMSWPREFPLIREHSKCIKCMRCIQVCDKIQTLSIWDLAVTGSRTFIDVSLNRQIADADCSLCGQCITHCPVGALHERDDTQKAFAALADPEITTVVQIAPAVRTAWGEEFGLTPEEATVNRLAGCLKHMGFDYVFDTSFSADLTIMEEATEFIHRFTSGELAEQPMFTSCCPGWVRFLKSQYPELTGQLSTAKSPQQMFGTMVKSYFAEKKGIDPRKIVCISIMPCLAKKGECDLPTLRNPYTGKDVELALTVREVNRMIRAEHIVPARVHEVPFDSILGDYTGAGVIFGATGGVMEAALRSANYMLTGKNPDPDAFQMVRAGQDGWKEAEIQIAGNNIRCAIASGLGNARKLIKALKKGKVHYDFVEVMACPGGCSGGGGQPIDTSDEEKAFPRGQTLYRLDREQPLRFSHENPDIQKLYQDYLGEPCSERAEELLHTDHKAWYMPMAPET
jgi:NADH-quinone oxidoreductase subunit G